MTHLEQSDQCIYLEHRFATKVMPCQEEAAELEEQGICQGFVAGERCYYRLPAENIESHVTDENNALSPPCLREQDSAKIVGSAIAGVLFEGIMKKQFPDGLDGKEQA